MLLFAETIETVCYSFDQVVNGVPVFAFGKALTPSPAPFHRLSNAVFVVLGGRRRLEAMSCASERDIAIRSVHSQRELPAPACPRYG